MDTVKDSGEAAGASLSGKERRELRARAHALKPVVWVAESGVTPGAMREIDRALAAHELIKIHAACAERTARSALLTAICAELKAQPVQVIGKMLVAFRRRPAAIAEHDVTPKPANRSPKRSTRMLGRTKPGTAGTLGPKRRSPLRHT